MLLPYELYKERVNEALREAEERRLYDPDMRWHRWIKQRVAHWLIRHAFPTRKAS